MLVSFVVKMAQFLSHLHQNNIIYGNLNPENICLSFEHFPKSYFDQFTIINFGSTFEFSLKGISNSDFKPMAYTSPEVLEYMQKTKNM